MSERKRSDIIIFSPSFLVKHVYCSYNFSCTVPATFLFTANWPMDWLRLTTSELIWLTLFIFIASHVFKSFRSMCTAVADPSYPQEARKRHAQDTALHPSVPGSIMS
ncbi:hypothetical protein DUNSADRAFT_16808 [Dunaliella salina]|uniref:Uncharacterized protein n=1 Tax=Dunaliella salina TaxID=3046 RepID=A0ABQ7H0P7_DUNSA|nr:hypothetical protein DUNSADRAFT_16808 [Dunaliella salina]|eukprot:KAF5840431.1 hypothetical protein DUNSADRAFT_16808 [Dunaliella salina]